MEPRVAQWIAELPADLEPAPAENALPGILEALSRKPVPASRLARSWTLGTLPARIAAAYGWHWLTSVLAGDEARSHARDEAHAKAALQVLGSMGYLRGAILKVGQTLAAYPAVLPRQFVETLDALHFEAPPMHYSLLREYVRRELGGDPEELFAEFETRAFAAASLGQVHRARLHTGERVAVKIQYPNIARTIRSDLGNLRTLLAPLRFRGDIQALLDQLEDVELTLLRETDYAAEARAMDRVRELLVDLEDVVVPRVHPELSSGRVLTMELLEGVHPHRFVESRPSQAERDRRATQILRAVYRIWCHRAIAADPNPGNFVLMHDGRLGLLDFGCLRELDEDEWEGMRLGLLAVTGDEEDLRRALVKTMGLTKEDQADAELMAALRDSTDWLWEPLRVEGPFDFSDEAYLRRGVEVFRRALSRCNGVRHMPAFTWMNRLLLGIRGLFYTLGARVDYKRVNDEELARAGLP